MIEINLPNVLLTGEKGVGKTTILNLLPGEILIELDDDLNEIINKSVEISSSDGIIKCNIKKFDLDELLKKSRLYKEILKSVNIFLIVTNSAASNIARTKKLLTELKTKVSVPKIYILANFQDEEKTAIEPKKIEEIFGVKTYGISSIQKDSKKKIIPIIKEILDESLKVKIDEEKVVLKEQPAVKSNDILIFVSYSTLDSDFFEINNIAEKLQQHSEIKKVFYWEEDLKDDIYDYMNRNLDICDAFLLFCSKKAKKSEQVQLEWKSALKIKKPIIPIFKDEKDIPTLVSTKLGVTFDKNDIDKTVEQLYQLILKKLR
ncbi:MAG: TIR domain-containing protein [Promethearchaeota archaeon]